MRSRAVRLLVLAGCAVAAGCTSTPSASVQPPSAPTVTTASSAPDTVVPAASTPTLATTATATVGAVAFFQAQEAGCAQHAATTGNPVVEPDRFVGASQVRNLGSGSYLVRDGRGTELVVQPAKGVVLPASGKSGDPMPAPYGFGCSETVFLGGSD